MLFSTLLSFSLWLLLSIFKFSEIVFSELISGLFSAELFEVKLLLKKIILKKSAVEIKKVIRFMVFVE